MPDSYERKPATNTLLTILTALDLLFVVIGVAFLPIFLFETDSIAFDTQYPMGVTSIQLLASVMVVGIGLVITAWLLQASNKVKAARLFAAIPLFWGMAVFLMIYPAIG